MEAKILLKRKFRRFRSVGLSKNAITWCFIGCLGLLAVLIYNCLLMPQINLKGKSTVIIDYKDKYVEKGYKASFLGMDVTKAVKVRGKVNPKKIGTYKLMYIVKDGILKKTVTRKVVVEDKVKPNLDIDDSDIYLCPGDDIVPDKVQAKDEYDGDLTEKVTFLVKKDKITYSVSDSSGNKREVSKRIIYKDIQKPNLTLKGESNVYLFVGDKYNDSGYDVKDNCDKNISENVKKSGSVNTNKVGDYTITYSVKDSAGNESKVTRKIKVSEKAKNGTIYLTFDDGPNSGTTDIILDILKEEGVKATFFVTNKGPDSLIKRAYDEGHSIALHTATHDYAAVYASVDAYFNDLSSVQARVKRITGYESKIIRFPGGSSNTVSRRYSEGVMTKLTNEVINRGFKYYDWNLSSGDAESGVHSSDEIINNVTSNLRKDRVNMVLMHDIKVCTRDALRQIIKYGKNNGYNFKKITMGTEMVRQRVNN